MFTIRPIHGPAPFASSKLLIVYPVPSDHILLTSQPLGEGVRSGVDKLTVHVVFLFAEDAKTLYDRLMLDTELALHSSGMEIIHHRGYSEIKAGFSDQSDLPAVCTAIASYVVDYKEKAILQRKIAKEKDIGSEREANVVLDYCLQLMEPDTDGLNKEPGHGRLRRVSLLALDILDEWNRDTALHLDGFLRFRLRRYADELQEVMEYALDEYLMDQQYKEFISLLKYFVYIQDSKIPEAHLMHKGGHEFILMNERMEPINTEELDVTFKVEFLDKDFSFEDLIVSTLITIAPKRVYVHTREPDLPLIHTIMQVFEDRAEICDCCRHCKPFLGEGTHKNKLST